MLTLVLKALLLIFATFAAFAWLGWHLAQWTKPKPLKELMLGEHLAFERDDAREKIADNVVAFRSPAAKKPETEAAPKVEPKVEAESKPAAVQSVSEEKPKAKSTAQSTPKVSVEKKATAKKAAPKKTSQPKPKTDSGEKAVTVSALADMGYADLEKAVQAVKTPIEPERLNTAKGKADDLKVIIGIGPVNEKELNSLGIYHFKQIAAWSAENVAWVSQHIRFAGRITKENWMAQAAKLIGR